MRATNIVGPNIVLRAVEPEDLDIMYVWENDPQLWEYGHTRVPYSRYDLHRFITSQSQDLGCEGQLRLMICKLEHREFRGETICEAGEVVGVVDVFDYSPIHHRAGVGIIIDQPYRGCGYGRESLLEVEKYLKSTFELHQLWSNVACDNSASLSLFEKCGYSVVGVKKEWIRRSSKYIDEVLLQKIIKAVF
ncbi:MAG: GNAT family N-acetyltransferase [Rikenellaceae bacterium]